MVGYSGAVPPKWLLVPPQTKIVSLQAKKRPPQLCPEEINRFGANEV